MVMCSLSKMTRYLAVRAASVGLMAMVASFVGCGGAGPSAADAGSPSAAEGGRKDVSAEDGSTVVEWPRESDAAVAVEDPDAGIDGGATLPVCTVMCDAVTPSYPVVTPDSGRGNITMYSTEASNGGACNYGATGVLYFVAVNVNMSPGDGLGQWQGGRSCGQCVEVTATTSQGPKSVVVRIMDKCPDGYCGMDLGGRAPAAVMRDGFGRYDGSWRFVSCAGHPEVSDGPTSLAVGSGVNAYWSRVQVRNPPGAVTEMTWRNSLGDSGALVYARDPENTFEVPTALLQSVGTTITITARFSDGTSASVDVTPAQLATENTSYVMRY
jgi:hypothetical protein